MNEARLVGMCALLRRTMTAFRNAYTSIEAETNQRAPGTSKVRSRSAVLAAARPVAGQATIAAPQATPREGDVYALVVARKDGRLGPKLTKSDMECEAILEQRQAAMKEAMAKARTPKEQQAVLETLGPKTGEPLICNTSMTPAATPGGHRRPGAGRR